MNPTSSILPKRKVTPEDLVLSIRQGLESRDRRFQAPVHHVPVDETAILRALTPFIDLEHVQGPVHTGRIGRVKNYIRRKLQVAMRPWFQHQTSFNRVSAEQMQAHYVSLLRRMIHENAQLHERLDELRNMWFELNRRVADLSADSVTPSTH
jgi:hypothetical protein